MNLPSDGLLSGDMPQTSTGIREHCITDCITRSAIVYRYIFLLALAISTKLYYSYLSKQQNSRH